jgi:hypothetical protein
MTLPCPPNSVNFYPIGQFCYRFKFCNAPLTCEPGGSASNETPRKLLVMCKFYGDPSPRHKTSSHGYSYATGSGLSSAYELIEGHPDSQQVRENSRSYSTNDWNL